METVLHPLLPGALRLEPLGDGRDGVRRRHTVEPFRVDERALPPRVERRHIRPRRGCVDGRPGRGLDHLPDLQSEREREGVVALVVRRHRHDGPGAVLHQHVIGDPDGHLFARGRVPAGGAGEHPGLLLLADTPGHDIHRRSAAPVCVDLLPSFVRREDLYEWVLRSEHHVRRTEHGVGARREDLDRRAVLGAEHQLRALRATDPVRLHQPGRLRPIDPLQVLQQPFGERRDPEEPLLEEPLRHRCVRMALAPPVDHLFIREDRLALGAPVHGRLLLHCEAGLEQLEEDPLGPLVVARIRGLHFVVPVEHQADTRQLLAEPRDVARDQFGRMRVDLEGVVLRVDAERVEPDRLEHVPSLETAETSVDVGADEREDVPHMQPFGRRIGEHHQVVVRPHRAGEVGGIGLPLTPATLPPCLDRRGIVPLGR